MGACLTIALNIKLDKIVSCTSCQRTCSARHTFRSLQNDWNQLRTAKDDVRTKIELEERQHKRRLEAVVDWLQQVESIESKFDKLKTEDLQQSDNTCCWGYCPRNIKSRYSFGKEVADVREEVVSLLKSKPEEVAQNMPIAQHKDIPVGQTIGLQSMLDKVWRYFGDLQGGTISLYGMGGVGKTTLLKELHNKLCQSNQRVDVMFWIVVSANPTLTIIQNDIGKKLGFHNDAWKEKREDEKAQDIFNVLKEKKYVLFLDDVWGEFDLVKLGLPLPNESNESKVVLTTRLYEVCGIMKSDMKIKMNCLGEVDAWNLFCNTVGENVVNAPPEIKEIAQQVANECDGLPLALIVIGQTVSKNTTRQAWVTSFNRLKKYTAEFKGVGDKILPLLKFSYDNIQDPVVQSCFLYCSLYPEDYSIRKKDIIDKWICEGFLDRFVELEEARNEGNDFIDTLLHASLLEEPSPKMIKMHDIIREMAIWICSDCGNRKSKFFVGVGLTKTPNVTEFEGLERLSLMDNQIHKLNGKLNCPNMLTLFLNEAKLNHIDNEFFQSMTKLRVLDLSNNEDLTEIPEEVCNLVSLQYLNLASTGLSTLPVNLHKLINLKWLSIRSNKNVIHLPEGLLSSFKKLQVLYLYNRIVLPRNYLVETGSLKHLDDLRIKIST